MNVYTYRAALICEECADIKINQLRADGAESDDSDYFPQGPFHDSGGEADVPLHCDECNMFLENPLTDDGIDYARHVISRYRARLIDTSESRDSDKYINQWIKFYGI